MTNVNGIITLASEAKLSVLDRGFIFGDSIYEVTRTYDGVPFYLDEHFERLENSARLAKMKITQTRQFLVDEIRRTLKETNVQAGEDVFIRYMVSRGIGPLDLDPATATTTSYVIIVKDLPKWNSRHYSEGLVLGIPSVLRNSPRSLDPNIKSGNYLNNILAVAEAKEMGAEDALMVSFDGNLTEASNSNVTFVFGNQLKSPLHNDQSHTGNLAGITRKIVSEIATRSGLDFQMTMIDPQEIAAATECFVTSATREIMPVKAILQKNGQHKDFPLGGGPVTKKLILEYKHFVREYTTKRKNEAWF